jgi:hypothetical protein
MKARARPASGWAATSGTRWPSASDGNESRRPSRRPRLPAARRREAGALSTGRPLLVLATTLPKGSTLTVPNAGPPERFVLQLDGLDRLASARDILDAVLAGHWPASSALVGAVADLVSSAEQRFAWAEALAA